MDVGDGACTVLRRSWNCHNDDTAVIDCGSTSISASLAARRLLIEISNQPEDISTIIVTHFDTDHFLGLLELAKEMKAQKKTFRKLNLIAPRPPDAKSNYSQSYLALASYLIGVRNLDLAKALKEVTQKGHFTYTPVFREGPGFWAAHSHYSVHWPPRNLPTGVLRSVKNAITLYEDVAKKLKEKGIPDLEQNMKVAREGNWLNLSQSDDDSGDNLELNPTISNFDDNAFDEDIDEDIDLPESANRKIPEELHGDFKKAWNAFRRANNNMSIVFDDDIQKNLVVFGDAESPVLRWIARQKELSHIYEVMLAPHHGTQRLPRNFATQAWACVSQNGSTGELHWEVKHLTTHINRNRCKTTLYGNHHFYIRSCPSSWCYC